MSSCIKPRAQLDTAPLVLLHGFDSISYPSAHVLNGDTVFLCSRMQDLRRGLLMFLDGDSLIWATWLPSVITSISCELSYPVYVNTLLDYYLHVHYEVTEPLDSWESSYVKRPMILDRPSLGAAVAIDFAVNHPEAVDKLILIDASVYAEGIGNLATLPKLMAYAGVYLLKSLPLRLYATSLTFNTLTWDTCYEGAKIGRLHCLLPWWADATVDFMTSGGYNVSAQIRDVKQKTLIVWGENDQIIDYKLAVRLHSEIPNAMLRQIPECGHILHIEKPAAVSKLITEFVRAESKVCMVA
ncbi:hypothetical protein SASPL_140357 [Salvia splendens]|uniref:AB hydrolase-1 domain-containing protein n=2 Tax=Salvia splendens TaxID=180675 RepID=A0A8X8WQB1_SALSN|nr:hypothetical protein SASPL_140357 [Salvia splendens]